MSFFSRLTGNREDSPKVAAEEVVVDPTPSAPIMQEPEQEMATVTPEVVATAQEKQGFESLVGRIFLHRDGDSTAKTWAVRVLAVLLLPFTVLTAILDAGRFAAYKAGLINGQSYSLIDMTSSACQAAAAKVKSVYDSYVNPVRTIEQENEETVKQMQKLSEELVQAYDALNASHFSDSRALKAAQRIPEIQKRLINEINAYVARNAASPEEFAVVLERAKDLAATQIRDAAGNRVYIANKVERLGPPSRLADVIIAELNTASETNQPALSAIYAQVARQGAEVVSALKEGVKHGHMTAEQAKAAVADHAASVFSQNLQDGLTTAQQVTEAFVKEAAREGLVNEVEAKDVSQKATANVSELAIAAAKDVARTLTEGTTDQEIEHQLMKAAEKLIDEGRLPKESESTFLAEARAQVQVVRDQIEAERQAQLQQEQEIQEALAQQEAEAIQKAELVQKQGELMGTFLGFLDMVKAKQKTLVELHEKHSALTEELKLARIDFMNLQSRTTQINGHEVSMLEAARIYNAEVARISGLDVPAAERRRQLEELTQQGFDQNTVEIITQLTTFTQNTIMPIIVKMSELADQITVLHEEVRQHLEVYNVFRKNNLSVLDEEQQKGVVAVEKQVLLTQNRLNAQHDKLLRIPYIQRMKGQRPVVETDAELNRAEVARLIEEHNRPEPEVVTTVDPARTRAGKVVDNFWGLLSYFNFFNSKKTEELPPAPVVGPEVQI